MYLLPSQQIFFIFQQKNDLSENKNGYICWWLNEMFYETCGKFMDKNSQIIFV